MSIFGSRALSRIKKKGKTLPKSPEIEAKEEIKRDATEIERCTKLLQLCRIEYTSIEERKKERKEGRKKGRKEGKKERKEGKKER